MTAYERLMNIDKAVQAILEKGIPDDQYPAGDDKYSIATRLGWVNSSAKYILKKINEVNPEILRMDAEIAGKLEAKCYPELFGNKNLINSSKNLAFAERLMVGKIKVVSLKAPDKEQQETQQPQPVKAQSDKVEKEHEQKSLFDRLKHGVTVWMSGEDNNEKQEKQAKKSENSAKQAKKTEKASNTSDKEYIDALESENEYLKNQYKQERARIDALLEDYKILNKRLGDAKKEIELLRAKLEEAKPPVVVEKPRPVNPLEPAQDYDLEDILKMLN